MTTIREAKKQYEKYHRWIQDPKAKPNNISRWTEEMRKYKSIVDAHRYNQIVEKVKAQGVDFDEWEAWARSLYEVRVIYPDTSKVGQLTVISSARSQENPYSWIVEDEIGALEKIAQLIGYKIYDRKRGRGDIEKDLA